MAWVMRLGGVKELPCTHVDLECNEVVRGCHHLWAIVEEFPHVHPNMFSSSVLLHNRVYYGRNGSIDLLEHDGVETKPLLCSLLVGGGTT